MEINQFLREKRSQITTLPQNLRDILIQGREDPILFINELLGMPLHRGQMTYLKESKERQAKKNILVPSNRWGKSTLLACLQIHALFYKLGIAEGNREAWTKAEYRTANLAPHSAQTEPVFKYIDQILTGRYPIRRPDGTLYTNQCQIEWFYLKDKTLNTPPYKQHFANNSYIEHRSLGEDKGGSLQGKPYGLITYDEGGRSLHLEEEITGNILPRLFDWSGDLHIPSTPDQNSPSILYHYQMYQDGLLGLNSTYTMEGSLRDNTFFTPDQIQEMYDLYKDDPLRDQVLEGKFVFGGASIYNAQDILDAQDISLNDGVRYEEGHRYVAGTDTAMGEDEFVDTILDITDLKVLKEGEKIKEISGQARLVRQVAGKGNAKSPQAHINDHEDLLRSYWDQSNLGCIIETWNGESARFYQDLSYDLKAITTCYGSWQPNKNRTENTNPAKSKSQSIKKADVTQALNRLLAAKALKIPKSNVKLIQQLSIYKEDDAKIPTDRVISLALAAWLALEDAAKQTQPIFINL